MASTWFVVVAPIPWVVDVVHGRHLLVYRCSLWIYFASSGKEHLVSVLHALFFVVDYSIVLW